MGDGKGKYPANHMSGRVKRKHNNRPIAGRFTKIDPLAQLDSAQLVVPGLYPKICYLPLDQVYVKIIPGRKDPFTIEPAVDQDTSQKHEQETPKPQEPAGDKPVV